MSLAAACEQLVRYVEDRRGELREKPARMSWYQYLQSDLYAKKMLERIVEEACVYMPDSSAVNREAGNVLYLHNRVPFTDRQGRQGSAADHEVKIMEADEKMYDWVRGCIALDVRLSGNYTAGIRVLFG